MAEYERPWNKPEWREKGYPFDRLNAVRKSLTPAEKKAIRAIAQELTRFAISPSQPVLVVPGHASPKMMGESGYYNREDQSYYNYTLTLEVGEDWLAAKRAGTSRDPVRRKVNVSLEDLRRAVDAAKERDRRENTLTSFRAYERASEAFHGHRPQASLSELQLNALCLAASRKSGLVTTGHGYTSAKVTLQSLAKLGLLVHQASGGAYYRYWSQYKITDAGRAAALENCAHYVRGDAK